MYHTVDCALDHMTDRGVQPLHLFQGHDANDLCRNPFAPLTVINYA